SVISRKGTRGNTPALLIRTSIPPSPSWTADTIACTCAIWPTSAWTKIARRPQARTSSEEIRNAGFWGFWKLGREIVGPDGELIYPERCNRLDYEGEIAIVLGKRGADLKASQLKDYVWGVTMLADWSIRAPRETPGGPLNFNFPKNFDTSCSMGPCIAVGEADPTNIDMESLVNGECGPRFT